MLDPKLIRENPDLIRAKLAQRGGAYDLDNLLKLDAERRRLVTEVERLRREKKSISERVRDLKGDERAGGEAQEKMAKSREISSALKEGEDRLQALEQELEHLLLLVPNLPHDSVPAGQTPEDSVEVRRWGTPRTFERGPHGAGPHQLHGRFARAGARLHRGGPAPHG
jgi:seryl-tRNA synthetase